MTDYWFIDPNAPAGEEGDRGVKAAYVGKEQKDETIKQQVLKYWEMFRSIAYQKNLVCLAIDEAHCVKTW